MGRWKKGFTLIEVVVVVAVIAILAAILTPFITKYIDDSNVAKAGNETQVIGAAVVNAMNDLGRPRRDPVEPAKHPSGHEWARIPCDGRNPVERPVRYDISAGSVGQGLRHEHPGVRLGGYAASPCVGTLRGKERRRGRHRVPHPVGEATRMVETNIGAAITTPGFERASIVDPSRLSARINWRLPRYGLVVTGMRRPPCLPPGVRFPPTPMWSITRERCMSGRETFARRLWPIPISSPPRQGATRKRSG
jgi:prepilin-type N-terminal cleavage/methylation domain-containing protein